MENLFLEVDGKFIIENYKEKLQDPNFTPYFHKRVLQEVIDRGKEEEDKKKEEEHQKQILKTSKVLHTFTDAILTTL
eukprot:74437-Ditylum_brightwellii.AAC.1